MRQTLVLMLFWLMWPQSALAETSVGSRYQTAEDLTEPLNLVFPQGTYPPLGMSSLSLFAPSTDPLADCAPDSPCSDAKAAWPLGAYSGGVVEDRELTGQFALIVPLGVVFLLTLLFGPGSARRKSF